MDGAVKLGSDFAMIGRVENGFSRAFLRTALFLLLGSAMLLGCRNAPFYRMTSKASQSLPLRREGIVAFERGDLDLAETRFQEALKLNDSDVETNRYYGETLWLRGKRQEAMEVLRSAAGKHGGIDAETSLYLSLGEKSLELEDFDEASIWANKVVDLSPKSVEGWELCGKVDRALGNNEQALLDFQRAAHFSVDDRRLLFQIATLQNELGDYDSGLATWQCLERLYPTNHEPAFVFAGKGEAYVGLGLYADAATAYEVAMKYEPTEPLYRARLAETSLFQGRYDDALATLDAAGDVGADDPECLRVRQRVEAVARANLGTTVLH